MLRSRDREILCERKLSDYAKAISVEVGGYVSKFGALLIHLGDQYTACEDAETVLANIKPAIYRITETWRPRGDWKL